MPLEDSFLARFFKSAAVIEPFEVRAVILSMLYFLFLFGSYSVVKPVRDADGHRLRGQASAGALYGDVRREPAVCAAVLGSGLAHQALDLSALGVWFRRSHYPCFLCAVRFGEGQDRWIAAAFYVWVSTFNMLIISVFWTFMADIFSRTQAKRLFGFVAAGGTIGGIVGPAIATLLAKRSRQQQSDA